MKPKTFKLKKIQTRRLAASFEGLNSSLARLAGELWSCLLTLEMWFAQTVPAPEVLMWKD